jgi:hypothetical protein
MNIKRYTVKEDWKDYSVTLEVDHSILTVERAQMINDFWSNNDERVAEEEGDVVRAVIRFAGSVLINMMLRNGGTEFTEKTRGPIFNDSPGPIWTKDLHDEEGWGGSGPQGEENADYGWCGIRCIGADVSVPSFDDLVLMEVPHA